MLGIVAGIMKLGEQVGEQVAKNQIVIFCILLAVNRFSLISRKVESPRGKLESR
jgi:hypothetical protein